MQDPAYVLGHSEREVSRLKDQARLLEPITRTFLEAAGVARGMNVLDVGSGAGDVALLAAELVGPTGSIVGIDKAAPAIAAATATARARGLTQVSFRHGEASAMSFEQPFDAIIGRYVLLFQSDAGETLRALARHLRPGGCIVFHEPDWTAARSVPAAPTYDSCCQWIQEVFRRSGTDSNMAARLYTIFVRAGLGAPEMRMQTFIGGPAASARLLEAMADLVATVVPALERLGIATTAEIGIATLAERMKREVAANNCLIIGRSEVGAWARV